MRKYTLGKNTLRNLETLRLAGNDTSEILIMAVKQFIKETPIDFCIIKNGGYRTVEQQQELFAAGNSKCDGYIHQSEHQKGLAVDLVPFINGKPSWHKVSCFYLAGAFMNYCERNNLSITTGADWNKDGNLQDGWDPCHMQIKHVN